VERPLTAGQEWKRGWTLVLAAAAGFSFMSVITSGMGAFFGPLGDEFHWNRTTLSIGMAIGGIVNIVLSPFMGAVIDRVGSRRMALPGLAVLMIATAAFGLANGSVWQWNALWLFYGMAQLMVMMSVWTAAVAGAFTSGRGLAMGMTLTGAAVAQTLMPVLATTLIAQFGWRLAFAIVGFSWGGLALLLCVLFFRAPPTAALVAPSEKQAAPDTSQLEGLTIAQAWRDRALWSIAISTFLVMALTSGLFIHQIPILTDAGVTREHAAWLAALGGVAGIAGKLLTGGLMDRFNPNWVGGITLGITALAFAFLIDGVRSEVFIVVAILVNGYAAGTKLQICSYLTARYAGLRNYGSIFGFMVSMIAVGAAVGPIVAGRAYDLTGGYTPFLLLGAIGCFIGGGLIISLPRRPRWETAGADIAATGGAVLSEPA
jgi:predicted MFS family arabinose efflux permease